MEARAEFTLRIARLVQERPGAARLPPYYFLFPEFGRLTWPAARATLAALPKPLILAPLIEPGHVAVWRVATMEQAERERAEKEMDDQVGYFTEKLQTLGLAEADLLRLETMDGEFTLSARELIRWSHEYAIHVGVSVQRGSDPRTGQITVRPPGGGPPLGLRSSAAD